jgi:hypothetical protein
MTPIRRVPHAKVAQSPVTSGATVRIKVGMAIFDEEYRVIAVESQRIVIRGVLSGNELVIRTSLEFPLSEEAFPVGQLIRLSDPASQSSS